MASLYEIDKGIMECLDLETGEVIDPERLTELQMERTAKVENVACWIKNLQADAEALKAEKDAFAAREKAVKNKLESLKRWLGEALAGEKFTSTKAAISYRKSEAAEVEDEEKFVMWAMGNGHQDLLTFTNPTVNKTAIKKAIKGGLELPGAVLVERQNIQIK